MAVKTDEDAAQELVALRAQRDKMDRELVRKSYRIGELEEEIVETAKVYEESLSWRVTRPLRSLKTLAAGLRAR
jgi:hypothetical protein